MGLAAWVSYWTENRPEMTLYAGVTSRLYADRGFEWPSSLPSLQESPAFLRRALERSVDVALDGVRRVAVMTGGGLDSSVLLGLAVQWARRTGGTAFAACLDFGGPGDDRPYLSALQKHLGCEVIRMRPEDAAPRIALMRSGVDGAPATSSTMPMEVELMVRAKANGAERMLAGAGGDELFGGNPAALVNVARRGHPLTAIRTARRLNGFNRPPSPAWSWVVRPFLGRALPPAVRAWRTFRYGATSMVPWAGPIVRTYLEDKRRLRSRFLSRLPMNAAQRLVAMTDPAYQAIVAAGRQMQEHASGLDFWYPYMDRNLIAAVASMAPEHLLFGDRWRGLLRASAHDLLPSSLRDRMDKASFEPAMRRWVEAAGGLESLRPLASGRELASLGLVEPDAFRVAFERFVAEPEHGESWVELWAALAVEAWLRGRAS